MIHIFTDGATEGHNGRLGTVKHCGIGVYCPETGYKLTQRIQAISNNEAEFHALIAGMEYAIQSNNLDVQFCLDSMIVTNRANGKRPKKQKHFNARMDAFQNKVLELKQKLRNVRFTWIPREQNSMADSLSTASLK